MRISAKAMLVSVLMGASASAVHAQAPASKSGIHFPGKGLLASQGKASEKTVVESTVELPGTEAATVSIPSDPGSSGTAKPEVQLVSSKSLVIDFAVKGVGQSGLGSVKLWYTRNGLVWREYIGGPQTQSPFAVNVNEDGMYGFSVVASNGMGISKAAPQPGEPPQLWIEVDTTQPEVHLLSTQAGVDDSGRTLTLRWTGTDKNMVSRPITLSYAEQSQGPWTPFAMNLENNGLYTWHMSAGMPNQVLVRVEATDRAGNVGQDQSVMPAPVDLSRPSASILRISRNGVFQNVGR